MQFSNNSFAPISPLPTSSFFFFLVTELGICGDAWQGFACPRSLESHMHLLESMNAAFPPCGFLDLLLFMLVDES
jgi:hypothetical protein